MHHGVDGLQQRHQLDRLVEDDRLVDPAEPAQQLHLARIARREDDDGIVASGEPLEGPHGAKPGLGAVVVALLGGRADEDAPKVPAGELRKRVRLNGVDVEACERQVLLDPAVRNEPVAADPVALEHGRVDHVGEDQMGPGEPV